MRKLFLLVCTVGLFALFGTGSAIAGDPCPPKSPNAGGSPACGVDHNFPPPSCDNQHGNSSAHNPNCPPPQPPPEEPTCPPADGPISGVVQQISDAIRNGGGAPLADLIDQVNCGLVVGVLGL